MLAAMLEPINHRKESVNYKRTEFFEGVIRTRHFRVTTDAAPQTTKPPGHIKINIGAHQGSGVQHVFCERVCKEERLVGKNRKAEGRIRTLGNGEVKLMVNCN